MVLCVGRLCKQKRQTLLLNAFEMVARKALDWDLLFVGEGGLEKQLKKEIAKKGLTERVSIAKNVTDLSKIYENAHIYCQPSEWEGFPMRLQKLWRISCLHWVSLKQQDLEN